MARSVLVGISSFRPNYMLSGPESSATGVEAATAIITTLYPSGQSPFLVYWATFCTYASISSKSIATVLVSRLRTPTQL